MRTSLLLRISARRIEKFEIKVAIESRVEVLVRIGLLVDVAQARNTLMAVSLGRTVPFLLKRMKVDPAAASSPRSAICVDSFWC